MKKLLFELLYTIGIFKICEQLNYGENTLYTIYTDIFNNKHYIGG